MTLALGWLPMRLPALKASPYLLSVVGDNDGRLMSVLRSTAVPDLEEDPCGIWRQYDMYSCTIVQSEGSMERELFMQVSHSTPVVSSAALGPSRRVRTNVINELGSAISSIHFY